MLGSLAVLSLYAPVSLTSRAGLRLGTAAVAEEHPSRANSVRFAGGSSELSAAARAALDAVASRLIADHDLRLEVRAYASAGKEASESRRVSLHRAIAVREYLIGHGVLSSRMVVRAFGDQIPDGYRDRVDLVLLGR